MSELFHKFIAFIGDIAGFFWKTFFQDSLEFFGHIARAPQSSYFEILFVAFLLCALGVMLIGLLFSVFRLSPHPFISWVESFIYFFAKVGAWIILALIAAMVYEVFSRYVRDAPTKWAFEMAYMLMGTSFMFGLAYCLQMRRHIRVDFVYDHVPLRARAFIDLFGYLFLIPMLLWLCGGLWEYFHDAYKVNESSGESAWNPIIWPFKFTFVIGFVLLLMQCVVEILKSLMVLVGVRVPEPTPVEGLK